VRCIDIIKKALEDKNKYSEKDTKEIILLLNGYHLWNVLELFKILQDSSDDEMEDLKNDLRQIPVKNFKEVYITTKKFNIRIK
jgi:histone acetyltransferase (RNA polymerase elongator complex component)